MAGMASEAKERSLLHFEECAIALGAGEKGGRPQLRGGFHRGFSFGNFGFQIHGCPPLFFRRYIGLLLEHGLQERGYFMQANNMVHFHFADRIGGHLWIVCFRGILHDCDSAAVLYSPKAGSAVVQVTGEENTDNPAIVVGGSGTKESVDGWTVTIFLGPKREANAVSIHSEVQVGLSHVNASGPDRVAITSLMHGQSTCPGEDLRKQSGRACRDVDHDEDGSGKIARQLWQDFPQGFDRPSGAAYDDKWSFWRAAVFAIRRAIAIIFSVVFPVFCHTPLTQSLASPYYTLPRGPCVK